MNDLINEALALLLIAIFVFGVAWFKQKKYDKLDEISKD
ncbi:hypothetical protein LMG7974_00806 [Campylobacter majalis]|uniref:Small hydrophobic protein n=1 Tax=Campylobacter majalis TaxID=2790656 RepID=A0ABN7K6E4_9BACT|nr:hypothetical protein LMG7974_00806 [Campylobacter majalis]